MKNRFSDFLKERLSEIEEAGLYKREYEIASPQSSHIKLQDGKEMLNFCANNYLGLSSHPRVVKAAEEGLKQWGFGLSSVRFICGTQTIHHTLEKELSAFLGTESTILYPSCFDANGGLFETLFGPEDAIISDQLNHASIIDGIRLSKAKRYRYANNDMAELEARLKEAQDARFRVIATDGVFSMDGIIANLKDICDLADKYDALVMVDDCHATGFLGMEGRGSHEYCGVLGRIDILTGTLGKALGGASGGYVSGRKEIVDFLRQRSRPYLFSNTIAPPIVAGSLEVLRLLKTEGRRLREQLQANTKRFRSKMTAAGFKIGGKDHPISPVMLGDAKLAQQFARRMIEEGIYVIGFFYPVVPEGKARIRTQLSAAHSFEDIDRAVETFIRVGKELEVLNMKAIVKNDKAPGLILTDVPKPTIGDHDVLIKPHTTSICGTDVHIYKWDAWAAKTIPTPLVIGHEFVGEIVEVGRHVSHLKVGDVVTGEGHITCGKCEQCLTGQRHLCPETKVIGIHTHGCFAEYFPLPAENVFPVKKNIEPELAAIFDPFGNAVHTLFSFDLACQDVLITGAGPIGVMATAIAKHAGARSVFITDVNDYRLELARKISGATTINVSRESLKDAMEKKGIQGFSRGFEMAGNQAALTTLIEAMRSGGKVALLGILPQGTSIDWDQVIFKMLTIKGIYGREIFKTWHEMCRLIQGGLDIKPVITHRFKKDDFQKGFDIMLSGQCGKVVLEW